MGLLILHHCRGHHERRGRLSEMHAGILRKGIACPGHKRTPEHQAWRGRKRQTAQAGSDPGDAEWGGDQGMSTPLCF